MPLVPIADATRGDSQRRRVEKIVKLSNGNQSKFIPAKYGYGALGPQKY